MCLKKNTDIENVTNKIVMELIYRGMFESCEGVEWDVQILQDVASAPAVIGGLSFPGDDPLVFEWEERSKEEPLCGSCATLTLLSPGDRSYEGLYTVEAGSIRLDVYRKGILYWSGTLDPEFYEEPYSTMENYEVTLTFSDFGILDRLKYDLGGVKTLREIVMNALDRSRMNVVGLNEELISTHLADGASPLRLDELSVMSDNFYDEEGDALTLHDVLEGVLQPLGLKLVQRGGEVWVYDLNGLYERGMSHGVRWMSNDQMMGVDRVYNNVKVVWSPYVRSGNLCASECWFGFVSTPKDCTNLNSLDGKVLGDAEYYSYYQSTRLKDWRDRTNCGFTLWLSEKGYKAKLYERVRYFKIVPQYDGEECEGICVMAHSYRGHEESGKGWSESILQVKPLCMKGADLDGHEKKKNGRVRKLWASKGVVLPYEECSDDLLLRVRLNLLADVRFNPFESASNIQAYHKEEDVYNMMMDKGNYVYVPVLLRYRSEGSGREYVWDNRDIVQRDVKGSPVRDLSETYGRWVPYEEDASGNPSAWGYLCYYDAGDRNGRSGVLGWQMNRPAINCHVSDITALLSKCEAGQYVPYPNERGGVSLWIEVLGDLWRLADGGAIHWLDRGDYRLWDGLRWVLFKLPEMEVLSRAQFDQGLSTSDVVYQAEINASAKESLDIDTICGSKEGGVPCARGVYLRSDDGKQITCAMRGGRTTQIEELLIGSMYSQYGTRHVKLEGTMEMMGDGVCKYMEKMQGGKQFSLSGCTEYASSDTMESVLIELSKDEYSKRN